MDFLMENANFIVYGNPDFQEFKNELQAFKI
jgi:hypothetical protein